MRAVIALLVGGYLLAQFVVPGAWRHVATVAATPAPPARHATAAAVTRPGYDPDLANVTVLNRAPNGHFVARATVNLATVDFLVDTGATTIALSAGDARRANIAFDPARFAIVGQGAAGPVYGAPIAIDAITLDGRHERDLTGVVLKDATVSLLGQSFLRRYARIEIAGDRMLLR